MANPFYAFFETFYRDNVEDEKLDFLTNLPLPVANIIGFTLRIIAAWVFLFGSSWSFLRDLADSVDGPIESNNLAVSHLAIGFIWPITISMEFISGIYNLRAIRKEHEIKCCLMLSLILHNNPKQQRPDAVDENSDLFSDGQFTVPQINEDYPAYEVRVKKYIETVLQRNPKMTSELIQRVNARRYAHEIAANCAFAEEIKRDWNNHLHNVKRQKIEVILRGIACFFAVLFAVNECFEYVVKVGAASTGVVNFTLWLAPNIVWLSFPFFVTFTFVKLGVVLYDHISLVQGKGADGAEFLASVAGKHGNGWENLTWWESLYKPFTHNSCNLLLSYLVIPCRVGVMFSILATGTLISAPVATIIGSSLLLVLTVSWLCPWVVGVYKHWRTRGEQKRQERERKAGREEVFELSELNDGHLAPAVPLAVQEAAADFVAVAIGNNVPVSDVPTGTRWNWFIRH